MKLLPLGIIKNEKVKYKNVRLLRAKWQFFNKAICFKSISQYREPPSEPLF